MSKVLLDFYGSTCIPCKQLLPILDEFAKNNPDIEVRKLDVEDNMQIAHQYNVRSLPSVFMVQDDIVVSSFVGYRNLSDIQNLADQSYY